MKSTPGYRFKTSFEKRGPRPGVEGLGVWWELLTMGQNQLIKVPGSALTGGGDDE
jgi:hypothetical protein